MENGMLPRSGLLHKREAYNQYAADMMTRGQRPVPFEQWATMHRMPDGSMMPGPAMQKPVMPAMGERTAPAGSIEEKLEREAEMKRRMGPPPGMLPRRM